MRFFDAGLDLFELEFVVSRAQAVAGLAGVNGIGAKVVRRRAFCPGNRRAEGVRGI
jgi:hypothetical protein